MDKKTAAGAVASFRELHGRLSRHGTGWIYRGHADASWELIPKAGRKPYSGHEETLFESWKRRAVEHVTLQFGSVGIFRPRGVVPRIVRQGGLFTVHGPPERSLESLTRDRIVTLKQIVIAESYRSKLLVELARYGINSASLFPDLDGLSLYLNWSVESGEFLD